MTPSDPEIPSEPSPSSDRDGRETCGNCGAVLHGPYCAQCGQQRRGLDMPVATFVASAFAGLASFDGRFWRTVLPLVGRPGFLTRELIDGRRVRYVPPMRLYLFVSFQFFLTVQLTGQEIVVNASGPSGGGVVTIHTDGRVEAEEIPAEGAGTDVGEDRQTPGENAGASSGDADRAGTEPSGSAAQDRARDNSETTEPAASDVAEAEGDDFGSLMKNAIVKLAEDPNRGTEVLLRRLPIMVFVLVPLAALWLRLLFWRKQNYYVPNLVASLHLHSAVLLLLNIGLLTEYLPGPDVLGSLLVLWIPIYTLLTLKRVYRTGWWGSLWRMAAFGFVHSMALSVGMLVSVIVTGLSL